MLGAAVNYSPIRYLSLEAGVGEGGFGPQWGLAARPKLVLAEDFALNLTVGYSRGDYKALRFDVEGQDGAFLFPDASLQAPAAAAAAAREATDPEWLSHQSVANRDIFGVPGCAG